MVLWRMCFQQNARQNEFFEFKFKVAEATCVTLRIMKEADQTINENYL